ncbi:conserved Plasmodium protein, unknown function [Plasmodium gallinaceum]|uniref:Uncharacterized protein n=1 Tax=Plasmodium gallinaceum TaxID=5849 RepID=A0A1J1GWY5_PLAGA|nr:conserved Plasmodium protein, unknown function [Plasmodium gallinaceum]CRG97075.1 conserved Plasmodium protein, unknown function [Plasmodium gallinaceum]
MNIFHNSKIFSKCNYNCYRKNYYFNRFRNENIANKRKILNIKKVSRHLKKNNRIRNDEKIEKINLHLSKENITSKNLLKFIERDKKLLLYALCKIHEKKGFDDRCELNNLSSSIAEKIINRESTLNVKEKLIYLSCLNIKKYAEKINLIKDINIKHMDEKIIFNYFCTILKNRKNYLDDKEIIDDILFFFKNKINKKCINNISAYFFNLSYLNSKTIIKTNILYYFVLYMLKYIRNKIKKRMSVFNIFNYVELLTSIIHISKLKKEKSFDIEYDIEYINKIRMLNRNEYDFEISNFSNICNGVFNDKCITTLKKDLLYNDKEFYHYYNINDFIFKKEKNKFSNNGLDEGEENNDISKLHGINSDIIYLIYFVNNSLISILKKCQNKLKKNVLHKFANDNLQGKFYIISNYMFQCLHFNIFCRTLFHYFQEVIIYISKSNKMLFFYLSPSYIVHLIHLLSIQFHLIRIDENVENNILKNCLNVLFVDDCKKLSKKDKVLLYISISKLLFFSKKIYIEKLNHILSNEFINCTYRDLYSVVYSLNCSKYYDLPFIEALLRNIYKLKHKYSSNQLLTIISIFYSFNLNLSIFNLLLSYSNKNDVGSFKDERIIINEFEDNKEAKKLEEDLENKERILKEISSHIKENSNDNFVFNESDLLEFDSQNNNLKCDISEESILMDNEEIKKYLKKKRKNQNRK